MNFKLSIIYAFIFFSRVMFGQENCTDVKGDYFLNKANSMYWLSRARQNALPEAQKAYNYLDSAEIHIKENKMPSACKINYLQRIEIFRIELEELIEVTADNLNGNFPILPFLTCQYDQFEYYDEPIETALEKALFNLIESGIHRPAINLKEVLLFCVIDTDDQSLKEVATQYLNNRARMYVISDHEIIQALGENARITDSSLARLGAFYSTNFIGKLIISVYENSENVSYTGVRFEFYNLSNNELISNTYAEGMKVDMRGSFFLFFKQFGFFVFIGLCIAFCSFILIQKNTQKTVDIKLFIFSASTSLTLNVIVSVGVVLLFSTFAPKGEAFLGQPQVLLFPYFFSTILIVAPLLLFILSGLVVKRKLSDQQGLIFTFFFIAFLAITFPVQYAASIYLQIQIPWVAQLGYFILCAIAAYFSSEYLAIQYRKNKGIGWILLSFCFLVPLIIGLTELMKIGNEITGFVIYLSGIFALVAGLIFLRFMGKKRKVEQDNPKAKKGSTVQRLKDLIDLLLTDQANNKHVGFNHDHESYLRELITDFKGFRHLHLSGSSGIGKTTLIKAVLEDKKEEMGAFYGDCHEPQEGSIIPYEPFFQAFSEHLGEGVFYNGSSAAADLIYKAKPLLNLAGVGELTEQLNKNLTGFTGASVKEIVKAIIEFLNNSHLKSKKRIVIVIEDIHWIDKHTKELLKDTIKELFIATKNCKKPLDICVITSSSDDSVFKNEMLEFSDGLSKQNEGFSYLEWKNSEDERFNLDQLTAKTFVKDLLSYKFSGVSISRNVVQEIVSFVDKADTIKPRYVLEMIKYLLEKEYLFSDNGLIELQKDLDWDTIPFESDIDALYHEKFTSLPPDVLKVLESAAFVGMEFEADLLSKLWKVDRINLIHNLLKAEKMGIVVDVNDHDDYYRFGSKAIRAAMKRFSLTNQISGNKKIPQIIKEYHKAIIAITLQKYNDDSELLVKVPDDVLISLAERAMLVYQENPIKAQRIVLSAVNRCFFTGELANLKEYLKFIFLLLEEDWSGNKLYWDILLRANLLQLSSETTKYIEEFGTRLIQVIYTKILDSEGTDSDLICFYELILKVAPKDKRLGMVLSKYRHNPYSKFYTVLIDRENQEPKLFTPEQLENIKKLYLEFSTVEGYGALKQRLLGVLTSASSGDIQLTYIASRMTLIFPKINKNASLSEQLDFINENWRKLDFESIDNCGFLLGGLNSYLKFIQDKALIFKLNKIRLSLNERLNHRLGIFIASLELLCCFDQWSFDEYNEFAEHLFYSYPEGSFRAQIYPCWLEKVIIEEESLTKIEAVTLSLFTQLKKPDFFTEENKKKVRLPKEKYLELLQNKKLNDGKEKELLKLLLDYCPA
jgi:hypothetical protein